MTTAALIVAAGRGLRLGGPLAKQWQTLGRSTVLGTCLDAFRASGRIDVLCVVHHPDDGARLSAHPDVLAVPGGATRAASVRAGLEALAASRPGKVLIHDAARPLTTLALIDRVLDALAAHDAAAPALPVADALWRGLDGEVTGVTDRGGLYRAQTPQGFHFDAILAAHRANADPDIADDVAVARAAGMTVRIVEGEADNFKITRPGDLARAAGVIAAREGRTAMDIRTGNGFDVHAFGAGDHVTLCGVAIPFERGLVGHSDADVGMHAVTDAVYGALAAGDIGIHFPPSDPQWKGAASEIFLAHACEMARGQGFAITHADVTLICEAPKVGPHAAAMRAEMARIMGVGEDRVSVKATTSERLGFTGRGEGIAALASATLVRA